MHSGIRTQSSDLHTHMHTHTPHTCTPQLVMGEDAVLTFSCTSVVEREEWTEAFRVLNQLAQPCGTPQQVPLPITGENEERGEGRREGEVKLRVEFERAEREEGRKGGGRGRRGEEVGGKEGNHVFITTQKL